MKKPTLNEVMTARFIEAREAYGMTKTDFQKAIKFPMSRTTYWSLEKGEIEITLALVELLSDLLGVSSGYLLDPTKDISKHLLLEALEEEYRVRRRELLAKFEKPKETPKPLSNSFGLPIKSSNE